MKRLQVLSFIERYVSTSIVQVVKETYYLACIFLMTYYFEISREAIFSVMSLAEFAKNGCISQITISLERFMAQRSF